MYTFLSSTLTELIGVVRKKEILAKAHKVTSLMFLIANVKIPRHSPVSGIKTLFIFPQK
jgi:hypothetical protein